jgi:2'-5' RNA ligase
LNENQLYFLAIVPPEPLKNLLWEIKKEVARKFDSKAALRSPPHITLHMPFKLKNQKKEILISRLNRLAQKHSSLRLELDGFGAFAPKVIYINVLLDPELLKLQKAIAGLMLKKMSIQNANYKKTPFKPHLTIAFRDLKKIQFEKAWEYYQQRSFKSVCTIDEITLLKHNGKNWEKDVGFQLNVNKGG